MRTLIVCRRRIKQGVRVRERERERDMEKLNGVKGKQCVCLCKRDRWREKEPKIGKHMFYNILLT